MALRLSSNLLFQNFNQRIVKLTIVKTKTTLTDDLSTYVFWHPPQEFPYECTQPLPKETLEDDSSILKAKMNNELRSILNKKSPEQARLELAAITHTCKHRWFPRARDKKAKKTEMDREYL